MLFTDNNNNPTVNISIIEKHGGVNDHNNLIVCIGINVIRHIGNNNATC